MTDKEIYQKASSYIDKHPSFYSDKVRVRFEDEDHLGFYEVSFNAKIIVNPGNATVVDRFRLTPPAPNKDMKFEWQPFSYERYIGELTP